MPHFIFVQGNLGAGKTTIMSVMAHYYKNLVEKKFGREIKLFSNYELKGSAPMIDYSSWYDVADAQGSIVTWDESQMVLDSRQSLKADQIATTQLLNFCRKMGSVQMFASPSVDNIDTRLRGLIEVLLNVRKVGNSGISVEYFDYQARNYGPWGKFLNKRFIPIGKLAQIHKLNLFDTFQMVQGFPMPKTERETNKFFKTLEDRHNVARERMKGGRQIYGNESIDLIDRTEQSSVPAAV